MRRWERLAYWITAAPASGLPVAAVVAGSWP